jgi:large subunit ribosomal protein L21
MYAVVKSGGKQYRVQEGQTVRIEKIDGEVGKSVQLGNVLMFSDDENVSVGQPALDSVTVNAHIVAQDRSRKIIVFKYKKRKRYRRKQGHRQPFTAIKIDSIEM